MNPHRLKAYSLLLITAVIWGIAGPVIKITLGKISPDLFILYRFVISSIASAAYLLIGKFKLPKEGTTLIEIFLHCVLVSSVSLGLLFWGTSKTSLLDMSLISLFGPLLFVLSGYLFLNDKITKREKIGTLIAFLGALIIGLSPLIRSSSGDGQLLGNILIFLSLISGAAGGVLVKRLMKKGVPPAFLANLSFIVGLATILPYVIIKSGLSYTLSPLYNADLGVWLGIFFMAIISGNLAYSLNNMGQKTIELSEAAPFAYLYPIFSAILAVSLLGDKLTIPIIAGSIITLAGVVIAEIKKRRYN